MNPATSTAARTIPGPRGLPFVGPYWHYTRFFLDPIGEIKARFQKFGAISAAPVESEDGKRTAVFAFGPVFNQQVLSNPAIFHSLTLGGSPNSAHERLGAGLVFMNGDRHKQHRRLMMPVFHKKYVDAYQADMVRLTDLELQSWKIGDQRDVAHDMQRLTMSIANQTLFGLAAAQDEDNLGSLMRQWLALNVSPFTRILPANRLNLPYRRLVQVSERLEQKILATIAQKRVKGSEGSDLLALLLQVHDEEGATFTDQDLIGETTVLFIAGHETSANTLTWVLFLLAQHPLILGHVLDELAGVLDGNPPSAEQLNDLVMLDRVIHETLRLFPPLPWVQRTGMEPFEIGPYHLSAGSAVLLSHYMTHHMPELYPQPDKFLPDRWATIAPSPYEYIPFSAGPRLCLGVSFAMMEMKIILAMILQRYRLLLAPESRIDRKALPTLAPKNGMPMIVHPKTQPLTSEPVRGNVLDIVSL